MMLKASMHTFRGNHSEENDDIDVALEHAMRDLAENIAPTAEVLSDNPGEGLNNWHTAMLDEDEWE